MQARDIMTRNVTTIRSDASLTDAIAVMVSERLSGLPVLDASGALVGILTEGDLLRRAETGTEHKRRSALMEFLAGPGRSAGEYVHDHSRKIADLMTYEVITVNAADNLADVVALMERRKIRRVPVMENGGMVGLLSRSDLVRAIGAALAQPQPAPGGDDSIRRGLEAAIANEPWFKSGGVGIHVKDGKVVVEGIITDERVRAAITVAAWNVPGVTAVDDKLVWLQPATGMGMVMT